MTTSVAPDVLDKSCSSSIPGATQASLISDYSHQEAGFETRRSIRSSPPSHPTRTRNKRGVKAKNPRLVPSPSEHGRNPSRRECPGYLALNRRSLHHINLLNFRQCNSLLNSRHIMLRLMDLYLSRLSAHLRHRERIASASHLLRIQGQTRLMANARSPSRSAISLL